MPSNPQLKLMTELLKLEGVIVTNYQIIKEIGIVFHIENIERKTNCIYCGKESRKLHQNNELTIRDLSFGEQEVYLKINRRQMKCNKCGKKFAEELNYVPKKRTYTERFRKKIVEEVLNSDIRNTGERNKVSEQEIETMLKDIGEELMKIKPKGLKRLGIDEIAMIKGQGNYYAVLVDIDLGKMIGIVEKRTEEALIEYLKDWGEDVLGQIIEVSMDMWMGYKNVAKKLMPQAQSKYLLLKNEENLKEKEKKKLKEVFKISSLLGEMHKLKEGFREIFEKNTDWEGGLSALTDWMKEAMLYFPKSCGTIRRWLDEITAYFDNGTTQGTVEGINNKLKLIKRRGYGFRSCKNFSLRCFLTWHFGC